VMIGGHVLPWLQALCQGRRKARGGCFGEVVIFRCQ
jgi:hypothetical protein